MSNKDEIAASLAPLAPRNDGNGVMVRPRRLRNNSQIRKMVAETRLSLDSLVYPLFLVEDAKAQQPIPGFTHIYRWGIEGASKQIERGIESGVKSFLLFAYTQEKDAVGTSGFRAGNLLATAIEKIRKQFGSEVVLFSDVCLCPFTDAGHCGVFESGKVSNDASLPHLAEMALSHAQAGVDFVAPSDMMDGRVGAIRHHLDRQGMGEVGILSYTAKYASSYYGPFREALQSSPQGGGDRSGYQMDFRNSREALRELELDLNEGADIVMVKPALAYLDIISKFKEQSSVPVAAYSVSAEYEMVKQLAKSGMVEESKMVIENLTSIARAGASLIFTYHALDVAEKRWL